MCSNSWNTAISPDEKRNSKNQSQGAQPKQDAQSNDQHLIGGGPLRVHHLNIKMKLLPKQLRQLCIHSIWLALQFPGGSDSKRSKEICHMTFLHSSPRWSFPDYI